MRFELERGKENSSWAMGEDLEKPGEQQRGWCGGCKLSGSGAGKNQNCLTRPEVTCENSQSRAPGSALGARSKTPIPCKIQC